MTTKKTSIEKQGNAVYNVLAAGLLVCKGENDIECRIGDKLQVSEPPERVFHRQRDATRIGERTYYEGVLKLSLENGYYLEGDGIHFQPPKHGTPSNMGGRELWIWRRLD